MVTFFFYLCGPASAFSTNFFGVSQRGAPVGGPNSSLADWRLLSLDSDGPREKHTTPHRTPRGRTDKTVASPRSMVETSRHTRRCSIQRSECGKARQRDEAAPPAPQNLPSCHLLCLPASPEQSRTRGEKVDIRLQLWPLPPAPRSCASSLRDHRRPPNRSSSSKVRFAAPLPPLGSRSKCRDTELKP